jgi:hypothetical protein
MFRGHRDNLRTEVSFKEDLIKGDNRSVACAFAAVNRWREGLVSGFL